MKRLLALSLFGAALLAGAPARAAEVYDLDPSHTTVMYAVNHLGFSTNRGLFHEVSGKLVLDEQHIDRSTVETTVKTASIDSFHDHRDSSLRSDKFLDVAKYPDMKFVSTKVTRTGDETAKVDGNLTLHGVTKPVILTATLVKIGASPMDGSLRAGFSASGRIKRSDFGITTALPAVGDDVTILIDSEFKKS